MPLFKVDGLDDLCRVVEKAGQMNNGELIDAMLKAGAEKVEDEWIKEIKAQDLISPGPVGKYNMITNVGQSRTKKNKFGQIKYIYPQGEEPRKKGSVRNAAKAFYQHYGYDNVLTGKHHEGKFFVDKIEQRAEKAAVPVMNKIFEDYMKSIQK